MATKKVRVQVVSYTTGMKVENKNFATVTEALQAYGLNGDTVVNVNGSLKYDDKLSSGDFIMFSQGAVKSGR